MNVTSISAGGHLVYLNSEGVLFGTFHFLGLGKGVDHYMPIVIDRNVYKNI